MSIAAAVDRRAPPFSVEVLNWFEGIDVSSLSMLARTNPDLKFARIDANVLELDIPSHLSSEDIRCSLPRNIEAENGQDPDKLLLYKKGSKPSTSPQQSIPTVSPTRDLPEVACGLAKLRFPVRRINSESQISAKKICDAIGWVANEHITLADALENGVTYRLNLSVRSQAGSILELKIPSESRCKSLLWSLGFGSSDIWHASWRRLSKDQDKGFLEATIIFGKEGGTVSIPFE
jgi:hypothetical protein